MGGQCIINQKHNDMMSFNPHTRTGCDCADLLDAFVHKEGDKRGNQARTDIFKYCPEFGQIATE
jgi:hypothetical protein